MVVYVIQKFGVSRILQTLSTECYITITTVRTECHYYGDYDHWGTLKNGDLYDGEVLLVNIGLVSGV